MHQIALIPLHLALASQLADLTFQPADITTIGASFFYGCDAEQADGLGKTRPVSSDFSWQSDISRRIITEKPTTGQRPDVTGLLPCR